MRGSLTVLMMSALLVAPLAASEPQGASVEAPLLAAPANGDDGADPVGVVASGATAACAARNPPCGWIDPILDIDLPEKLQCGSGYRAAQELDPSECHALPEDGGSLTLEGTFRFYWDMSEEGTYPNDPNEDIVVTFGGSGSNPGWLSVVVEPAQFVIGTAELFNPDYWKPEENEQGTQRILFWFEQPITVTIERDGEPTPEDIDRMVARNGVQVFFVKVKSTGSGERFRPAFGIEEFRFYGLQDEGVKEQLPGNDTPAPGMLVGAAALAAIAVAARRRPRS